MKKILSAIIVLNFFACSDDVPTVHYQTDSAHVINTKVKFGDYDPKIPGLGAAVEDPDIPNEYQRKKQTLRDGTVCMSWSDAGFKNANDFIRFFKMFQILAKDDNKHEMAKHIKFPLPHLKTKREFLDSFYYIFDDEFKNSVVYQNPDEMYRDKNGAMAGNDGQIWFKPMGKTYKVVNMNF